MKDIKTYFWALIIMPPAICPAAMTSAASAALCEGFSSCDEVGVEIRAIQEGCASGPLISILDSATCMSFKAGSLKMCVLEGAHHLQEMLFSKLAAERSRKPCVNCILQCST